MAHASLTVNNDELMTVRQAMRDLTKLLPKLRSGELHQIVLMEKTEMVAVIRPIAARGQVVESFAEAIGGRELADAAVEILEGEIEPMHYRELAAAIQAMTGKQISGARPSITLLANIGRDPRIESFSERSGLYKLANPTVGREERDD